MPPSPTRQESKCVSLQPCLSSLGFLPVECSQQAAVLLLPRVVLSQPTFALSMSVASRLQRLPALLHPGGSTRVSVPPRPHVGLQRRTVTLCAAVQSARLPPARARLGLVATAANAGCHNQRELPDAGGPVAAANRLSDPSSRGHVGRSSARRWLSGRSSIPTHQAEENRRTVAVQRGPTTPGLAIPCRRRLLPSGIDNDAWASGARPRSADQDLSLIAREGSTPWVGAAAGRGG